MRSYLKFASLTALLIAAAPLAAQDAPTEYGIDAGATLGFGDASSAQFSLPASRLRIGFPVSPQVTLEPVAGLSYNKTEGSSGVFIYNLEGGALYNLRAFNAPVDDTVAVTSAYVRPFLGLTGYTGGSSSDTEFSAGTGIGVKVPWQPDLSWRLEANVGYGFSNKAARVGLLAGLSFFGR